MNFIKHRVVKHFATLAGLALLVGAMGGTWQTVYASPTPAAVSLAASAQLNGDAGGKKSLRKSASGKLNLNTASEDQLMLLPSVGAAKAERIVAWRKKNGSFKRIADLRRVKGFGYKTFKRLEPFLESKAIPRSPPNKHIVKKVVRAERRNRLPL